MSSQDRRTFLKVSGAVLGGIAVGSTVTAATSTDRYIVDTTGVNALDGVDVIHALDAVDVAVVRGDESRVAALSERYEPDVSYQLDRPSDGTLQKQYESDSGTGGGGQANGKGQSGGSSTASATDEPLYPLQWDKQALDVPAVHDVTRGEGTRIAIVDSGVAAGHPDLQHAVNTTLSRNFTTDDYGAGAPYAGYHGTHVAGIAAANGRNGEGVVGTAPATEVVDCRVFSPTYAGAFFGDILAAIVYSANVDCDVANLSLGAYPIPREGFGGFYGKSLNRTMTYVNKEGTLLCIAAGNDSADLQHDGDFISLPNEGAQAVSVSATGPIGYRWDADGDGETLDLDDPPESPAGYTNYGTNAVDLGAPGGDYDLGAIGTGVPWYYDLVLSTFAEPQFTKSGKYLGAEYSYSWVAGTSMAAPQVAGAAALVRSQYPDLGADQVESRLKRAADVPDGYDKTYYGSGFLNILDAL
ncbi:MULTISPECIES: S8 family serine peptidase [Salinibaculum]|uniref:S8 family serine peptidase n=1 Tax=Salinibaculum TaxID=2732368 RepID=UPI0030D154D6